MTRNRFAGEPFTDDDDAIAKALEEVSIPALMCSLVHMTGDPSWYPGGHPAAPRHVARHPERDVDRRSGRGAAPRPARHRGLSGRRLRARGAPDGAVAGDDGLPRRAGRSRAGWPACSSTTCSSRAATPGPSRGGTRSPRSRRPPAPVVVIGCGMGGILAGIRLAQAGLALHHRREERGSRRHLVGEPLPRGTRRRREPPVLLLLRAGRPLERVLLPAARAPGVLRHHRRQVRTSAPLPVRHHGDRGDLGRGPVALARGTLRERDGAEDLSRCSLRHQRGRVAQPAPDARDRRHGHASPARRSTRHAGRRTSTSAGPGSPSSAPARAASRSGPPSHRRSSN